MKTSVKESKYQGVRALRLVLWAIMAVFLMATVFAPQAEAGEIDLPRTGQTTSYAPGDDGGLQKGVAWPSPRFTDNDDGTVTDNLTGLVWLKNANCFGTRTWADALRDANNLASGSCGLTDGSTVGQWRLPNVNELESLVHAGQADIATWLNTQGFSNVEPKPYWSSTTYARDTGYAWYVYMWDGIVYASDKSTSLSVWPVR
jgi:hypothetical protein